MRLSARARRGLITASVLSCAGALASGASSLPAASSAGVRPTPAIVKQGLTKFWDTDQETSVAKITLKFRSLKLLPTRRAVPTRDFIEDTAWVTPVAAVFDQVTVSTAEDILNGGTIRSCATYRVSFTGIFWKGDFGWTFKNRDVKTTRLAYEYRC